MKYSRTRVVFTALTAAVCAVFAADLSAAEAMAATSYDVNQDGSFDAVDVVTLQKWLLCDDSVTINNAAADLNQDDVVDIFDLALLKRQLLQPDTPEPYVFRLEDVPDYSGDAWYVIDDNTPDFTDLKEVYGDAVFEYYAPLDDLGRCGVTYASICQELMPTEERGEIGSVKPSGWTYEGKSNNNKYDFVSGKYVYNRCHLIGFQLAGENANTSNLITGTRYLNIEGMLPFEDMVADYVHEQNNVYKKDVHVYYRVTPYYNGDDPVAAGVRMEGWSVEDEGASICFDVFCYNVQPGVVINYATGQNWAEESAEEN
ncbi:MAG: DNA/RNA non-specific endonuclease [Oscillospiraceae bacterium]|nr:DNA/RNA non-specific endonuclease [Oscillospiraceae bacterium]